MFGIYSFVLLIDLYLLYYLIWRNIFIIYFEVLGKPKALKRHRHFGRRTYDPNKQDKKDFLIKSLKHKPDVPIIEPIKLEVNFNFKRPISHYRNKISSLFLKKDAPIYPSVSDLDNLVKFVADSLNGTFYKDDRQIVQIIAQKYYHPEKDFTTILIDGI